MITTSPLSANRPSPRPAGHKAGLIIITIIGSLLCQSSVAWHKRREIASGWPDFTIFYTAGKMIAAGNGNHLYDLETQARVEGTFIPLRSTPGGFLPYNHAPFEALLFTPLTFFSYSTAFWIWWACNLSLGYLTLFLLRPHIAHLHSHFDLVILALGVFYPILITECLGQDSVLSLLLFTICFINLTRDRAWLAGCALAITTYKPQLALFMLAILVVMSEKRWHLLAGFLATCFGLAALSVLAVGWRASIGYPQFLKNFAAGFDISLISDMPNLRALMYVTLNRHLSPHALTFLVNTISIVLAVAMLWAWRRQGSQVQNLPLQYALLVAAMELIGYYGFFQDMTVLLLPLLLVWNFLVAGGLGSWNRKLLALCIAYLLCSLKVTTNPQLYACMLLIFFCSLCWEMIREKTKSPRIPELSRV